MVACTPHPGLGTVTYAHAAIDLATCKPPTGLVVVLHSLQPTVRARRGSQTILYKGKVVVRIPESYKNAPAGNPGPIALTELSPDRKWVLYAIDPLGSSSLAADGETLRAIRVTGGRSYTVGFGLLYDDYRTWCGNTLVMTAGGDRIAVHAKRLIATRPPDWKARTLVPDSARSFGSVTCSPDGKSVVAQEQPNGIDANFFHTHWRLVRVNLSGSVTKLTSPPAGYAEESPRFAGSVLYFVRSQKGHGQLYALDGGKLLGPLLSLGYSLGFYGHQDWPYTVTR